MAMAAMDSMVATASITEATTAAAAEVDAVVVATTACYLSKGLFNRFD